MSNSIKIKKMSDEQWGKRFANVWLIYPKQVGELLARQVWMTLEDRSEELFESILKSVSEHNEHSKAWNEGFIPKFTTFLSEQRWKDRFERLNKPKGGHGVNKSNFNWGLIGFKNQDDYESYHNKEAIRDFISRPDYWSEMFKGELKDHFKSLPPKIQDRFRKLYEEGKRNENKAGEVRGSAKEINNTQDARDNVGQI